MKNPKAANDLAPVNLYPHGMDCMSVIVPKSKHHVLFIIQIAKRKALIAIAITFALFVILRSAVSGEGLFTSLFVTLEICLAQNFIRLWDRPSECFWMVSMLAFALFSAIMMSSMLFVSLVNYEYQPEIDTMEQLVESGLTILVEDHLNLTKYSFFADKNLIFIFLSFTVPQSVHMLCICRSIPLSTI